MHTMWTATRSAAALAVATLCLALATGAGAAPPLPDPPDVQLTLAASPATLTAGGSSQLTARFGLNGVTVRISRRVAGEEEFTAIRDLTVGADGAALFRARPRATTVYRVDYAGDGVWAAASAEVTVTVRPRIFFRASAAVYRGGRAQLGVKVLPAHAGAGVSIQTLGEDGWEEWRTLTLDAASRATAGWPAPRVGRYALRAVMAADADHAEGVSHVRRVRVAEPNPYHVPLTAKGIIVVDISQYRLRFYSYGRLLRSFPCVTGRPGLPTPIGHFSVYARGVWPGGPYGARIMSYHPPCAIHGTNEPWLLARFPRNFSHGCTRLYNADAIWLYDHAPIGTPVWNVP